MLNGHNFSFLGLQIWWDARSGSRWLMAYHINIYQPSTMIYGLSSQVAHGEFRHWKKSIANPFSFIHSHPPKNQLGPYQHIIYYIYIYWLVVSTPLKNISQLRLLFPIYGKIKKMCQQQYIYINNIVLNYFNYFHGTSNPSLASLL